MANIITHSLFSDFDINLFKAGKHYKLYEKFGAHILTLNGVQGTYFAVWAPTAKSVSVIGDFNFWNDQKHPLNVRWDESGIWEGFIAHAAKGESYKYKIYSSNDNLITEKADPYARRCEHPPKTASIIWEDDYAWKDNKWMKIRKEKNALDAPYAIYEVHLGSWKRNTEENRFGFPDEFKLLVDKFHEKGIGIILDWVPAHFPADAHGLGLFDGSHLYEHPDIRKGYHQDWKSLIFNYGRNEVKSFLISNALFWLDQYHIDGLRVDAVTSMLFLDYSREDGEWEPNIYGGRENLEAIDFIKEMNIAVYENFPDVQTIAEESTSFSKVSSPVFLEGLGFGMKWMMGWMHDTLEYFSKEPIYRKHHQNELTFSLNYAFTENFMLPLSHDEVVYGKKSILDKMPGDEWQRFANMRLLFSFMYTHPGAKLLFQGSEFGQVSEWNFQQGLQWHLLDYDVHKGAQNLVKELNKLYRKEPALYKKQFSFDGFEWINHNDHENSVISYIRKSEDEKDLVIIICNLTPIPRENYRIGVPKPGKLKELFNSDSIEFNGTGNYLNIPLKTDAIHWNERENSIEINLPPLAMLALKY